MLKVLLAARRDVIQAVWSEFMCTNDAKKSFLHYILDLAKMRGRGYYEYPSTMRRFGYMGMQYGFAGTPYLLQSGICT